MSAVFLVGICWRRANALGAITSLIVGFVLGMGKLVLQLYKDSLSGFWYDCATIIFLHFAILLFGVCTAVLVVVSLLSAPPLQDRLVGLTFATAARREPSVNGRPQRRSTAVLLTLGVLALTAAAWIYFS